ncbi:hypothetical protein B0J14DRAFT_68614 [Halenospora varia]|nr:hypothetical protein B0J14DRAFT_68614 [Halenospora varia]
MQFAATYSFALLLTLVSAKCIPYGHGPENYSNNTWAFPTCTEVPDSVTATTTFIVETPSSSLTTSLPILSSVGAVGDPISKTSTAGVTSTRRGRFDRLRPTPMGEMVYAV